MLLTTNPINTSVADVVILGAGPAGLACAATLGACGYRGRVSVLDCGRIYTRRPCPVDQHRECHGCGGVCNVIAGFGGAMHYGDGVKLSKFPSGRRLSEVLGADRADRIMSEAIGLLLGGAVPDFSSPLVETSVGDLKRYPVASLSSADVRSMITRLDAIIRNVGTIDLHLNTRAVNIERAEGRFVVHATTSSERSHVFKSATVVVATGRRGFLWWRKQLRDLGIVFTPPSPSIGFRFDCPKELLVGPSACHPDFKTTIYRNGFKFKTFCFCAGPGGGRIKFTDYGPFTLLDGHTVVEEENPLPSANFALLAQLRHSNGSPWTFEEIDSTVIAPYVSLNPERPGKPIIQSYSDFKNSTLSCGTLERLAQQTGRELYLRDLRFANIATLLSVDLHRAYCEVLDELLERFTELSYPGVRPSQWQKFIARTAVMALELEGLWDEVAVDGNMRTSIDGLFVIGDCAGIAQGILQGATAGVQAAHAICDGQV